MGQLLVLVVYLAYALDQESVRPTETGVMSSKVYGIAFSRLQLCVCKSSSCCSVL